MADAIRRSAPPSAVVAAEVPSSAQPTSNTAATWTLTPDAGKCICIQQIAFSYSDDPTNATLKIAISSTNYFGPMGITKGGAGVFEFDPPLKFAAGLIPVVTLSAGGSGITGKLAHVGYWQEEP